LAGIAHAIRSETEAIGDELSARRSDWIAGKA
jgi:hypothetical protein